jgi:hypothetical protein
MLGRYSQTLTPWARRKAFSPVLTLSASAPHESRWLGRPMKVAQPASDSGTSLRNGSPSSVNENMRLSSS